MQKCEIDESAVAQNGQDSKPQIGPTPICTPATPVVLSVYLKGRGWLAALDTMASTGGAALAKTMPTAFPQYDWQIQVCQIASKSVGMRIKFFSDNTHLREVSVPEDAEAFVRKTLSACQISIGTLVSLFPAKKRTKKAGR